jgi:hypothetical protein
MSRRQFTEEQINILRQNPYVFSVTGARLTLTKEFKEIFMTAYQAGELPRSILEDHGFDIGILGERRIWSISQHIREEYKKYGEFHEGYGPRSSRSTPPTNPNQPLSEKDELRQLRHEVDYLKQEMEFLKKISSIRTTRK